MNKLNNSIFLGILISYCSAQAAPLLVLLIMVKDEVSVINKTLETYLSKNSKLAISDNEEVAYVIYDTGSCDGTEKFAEDFLLKKGIKHIVIKKEPFIDYSTSRNKALEIAEISFPDSSFIFFTDAEWYLNDFDGLLAYCKQHKHDNPDFSSCYNVRLLDLSNPSPTATFATRLMRTSAHVRFDGKRVHEIPLNTPYYAVPDSIFITYDPQEPGRKKSEKRWLRDKEWLLEDYLKNPQDRRLVFLLAQTCQALHEWENACAYYKKVIDFNIQDEYTYLAYYLIGSITEFANFEKGFEDEAHWAEAMRYYAKAYAFRSYRAEPLIKMANHYMAVDNKELCYIFAYQACQIAYPHQDIFVEKGLYDLDRFQLLASSAWFMGDFKNGESAARSALLADPNNPDLLQIFSCYQKN